MGALNIDEWFDAAWAALYWDVPGGFTNPFEYREMMHSLIFTGVMPEKFRQQQAKARADQTKSYLDKRRKGKVASTTPQDALAGLMAARERALALKAARDGGPDPKGAAE